jgi:hypothetical protein
MSVHCAINSVFLCERQLTLIGEGPYLAYTWDIVLIGGEMIRARTS